MKTVKCKCSADHHRRGSARKTKPFFPRLITTRSAAPVKNVLALAAGCLLFGSAASAQQVYMMEFNQANNFFGVFDLLTGNFSQLGSEGSTLFNDIAAAPGGTLYGIVSSASLVTLNPANGSITKSLSFNVSGIESLAVAPNGALYGATQSALYTIDPSDGQASLVGNFNNSLLGGSGQNIRFGVNGNLYDTDGGGSALNTDLFQISLLNGAASTVGVIPNIPGVCLANAGQIMYGVGIQLGSASTVLPELIGIDLGSIPPGGTNADGSLAHLGVTVVANSFLNNYNFSGATTYAIPGTPVSPVPEPGTVGLALAGGIAFGCALARLRVIRHPRPDSSPTIQ